MSKVLRWFLMAVGLSLWTLYLRDVIKWIAQLYDYDWTVWFELLALYFPASSPL